MGEITQILQASAMELLVNWKFEESARDLGHPASPQPRRKPHWSKEKSRLPPRRSVTSGRGDWM